MAERGAFANSQEVFTARENQRILNNRYINGEITLQEREDQIRIELRREDIGIFGMRWLDGPIQEILPNQPQEWTDYQMSQLMSRINENARRKPLN